MQKIWPRGLPHETLDKKNPKLLKNLSQKKCPIQQGLTDGDPDVDAIYRMVFGNNIKFAKNKKIILNLPCS